MQSRPRVVIVGGGISGLAAALAVQRASRGSGRKVQIDLCESSDRLGGKIGTERVGDFLVEVGPDTFLATKPAGIELCRELGLTDQVIPTRPDTKQSYLSYQGKLTPLPDGMSGLVPNRIGGLLSTSLLSRRGRFRASLERLVPGKRNGTDESVFDFASRRYGSEVAERIVDPLLSGICAGNGRALSAPASIPQLCAMEKTFGSISRGMRNRQIPNVGGSSPFVSLADGMSSLISRLQSCLDDVDIHLTTTVCAVDKLDGCYQVRANSRSLPADAVVMATPSYVSAELLRTSIPKLSTELSAIRFVSTATVALGFTPTPRHAPSHGYGYIVPRSENRPVTACTWTTLKLPNRSAEGSFLFRIFIGRDGEDDIVIRTDDELLRIAIKELQRTLGIDQAPTAVRVDRHGRAMPQYELGHLERLARIDELLAREPGFFLAGCSYRGVGIPDCVSSGQTAGLSAFRSLMMG